MVGANFERLELLIAANTDGAGHAACALLLRLGHHCAHDRHQDSHISLHQSPGAPSHSLKALDLVLPFYRQLSRPTTRQDGHQSAHCCLEFTPHSTRCGDWPMVEYCNFLQLHCAAGWSRRATATSSDLVSCLAPRWSPHWQCKS